MNDFCRSKEFEYVSIDATIKCCMSVMGQESYRASREKRNQAPFDDETALRRVLSVRGRTGAVLAMIPVSSERAEEVCLALATHIPAEGLKQVQCVASDNATHKLYAELRRIMPNLQCLALDPIHLCIVYENLIWSEAFFKLVHGSFDNDRKQDSIIQKQRSAHQVCHLAKEDTRSSILAKDHAQV